MVNPRKAYPIDSGLIPIDERVGRANLGHALEDAVFIELLRRGCEVHYFRTPQGNEIDFHAIGPDGEVSLIQVCADASDPETLTRETRSLAEVLESMPHANPLLITLDPLPAGSHVPDGIEVITAVPWFLTPT
jgi:predicted AAA+ superfamily ATPase